jgi:hypothetical protein
MFREDLNEPRLDLAWSFACILARLLVTHFPAVLVPMSCLSAWHNQLLGVEKLARIGQCFVENVYLNDIIIPYITL